MPDRLLPLLVAAMVFLAALAGAASLAAAGLAGHWRRASSGATVQVPAAEAAAAAALLGPAAHRLSASDLQAALQPWLGDAAGHLGVALPAVFTLPDAPSPELEQSLARAAPGALVSRDTLWQARLARLAHALQACAALAICVVASVAAGVVALATRAGLATRREAIEIVHQLGATDGFLAAGFAGRVSGMAFLGALAGTALAAVVLLAMAHVTAPFQLPAGAVPATQLAAGLPVALWVLLAGLPPLAALTGWLAAQATVRTWLLRLP